MSRVCFVAVMLAVAVAAVRAQDRSALLIVHVRNEQAPVAGATVTVGEVARATDADGTAAVPVTPGTVHVIVSSEGFVQSRASVTVVAGRDQELTIELVRQIQIDEEVTVVATTRTGRRLEDQPTRVEVLGRDEIEEKMLMTPGDLVMMLNEMGGLRVQATSPSIGAASVRVQGMKGRYTRFLSDGLPLFGQQVGGLGLLQIPPMDLGQVEVIKGTASALYGAGAMGGVVNLISRRPGAEPEYEALVNRSTLGATDVVAFLSSPLPSGWSATLLAGGHWQTKNDRDEDGWADLAAYERGVVRPRLFWDDSKGRSAFVTAGMTLENRDGGTMSGASLPATGMAYTEALETRRFDVGGTMQTLLEGTYVVTARGAVAWQRHHHTFGDTLERDRH